MRATMSGMATIQSYMLAAIAARRSGDFEQALIEVDSAEGLLAITPSSTQGGDEMRWDHEAIARFRQSLARQQSAAGGIQRISITREPVADV